MNTRSPLECPSWAKLAQHAESWRSVHLRELFAADATRERLFAAEAPGVRYDYSRQRLGAVTLRLLVRLAAERGFAEWREALLAGSAPSSARSRSCGSTLAAKRTSISPSLKASAIRRGPRSEPPVPRLTMRR